MKNYQLLEQEKRSIVDVNYPIYKYIYELVYICLGFKSHYMGSHYLSEFIEYIIENDIFLYNLSITKDIYPMISEKFKTEPYKVERAIRHSCNDSWKNMNSYIKENFFPNGYDKAPTSSEMIYAIYEYIKGHYIKETNLVKKTVLYKNNKIIEENESYINYKIRFEIQKLLYQEFKFSISTVKYLQPLIDTILLSVKANKTLTDIDINNILGELSDIYNFYEGINYNYLGKEILVNESENIILNLCKRMYENMDETYCLQKPKNKTYIKEYMNILSFKVKDKLSFYI